MDDLDEVSLRNIWQHMPSDNKNIQLSLV
jgi:hypothetical protein